MDSEVMRQTPHQRRRKDALKVKALRAGTKAGIDALERGVFTEVADADLDHYFEGLTAKSGKRSRTPIQSPQEATNKSTPKPAVISATPAMVTKKCSGR